jgi:hypothetical protein
MPTALRVVLLLAGAGFVLQGLGFLVDPIRAAASLDMALLDGAGRSTQIGDFAAFFLAGGVCILLGVRAGGAPYLRIAGGILLTAAFGRIVAWAAHGAAFAALFIVVEIVMGALCLAGARRAA